ncbi:MAG: restriction endonuclease [Fimbriimonadaceae bacterium]
MTKDGLAIWVVRGGSQGELDQLFLNSGAVAIGHSGMGNLSLLGPNRESFRHRMLSSCPYVKQSAVPNNAGQLYRFVHELQVGDIMVYPSKVDKLLHIGTVTGEYKHQPEVNTDYPHMRSVKWLKTVSRSMFSQGALAELNSILTIFQVKNYADEIRSALDGEGVPAVLEDDETVAQVAEQTVETTRDFILKRLAKELKGYPLQDFVAHLLETMGYHTRVQGRGADGGIDVIAHRDELGFEPPIIKVQVKGSEGQSGDPEVSSLYGKVSPSEFGLFVTLGTFSPKARAFALSKHNLRLIDGDDLVLLILEHYESFDSKYKSLLPLKRLYVPESL